VRWTISTVIVVSYFLNAIYQKYDNSFKFVKAIVQYIINSFSG